VPQIIVRRNNKFGQEIKLSESAPISGLHLIEGSQLYVQRGTPAQEGQIRVVLFLARAATESADGLSPYDCEELGELPIDASQKTGELRKAC